MNIYSNPGAFGLSIFGEVEYSSGCYEFDTLVIWQDDQARLWWARDSGCSCPIPFEQENRETIRPIRNAEDAAKAFNHQGYVGNEIAVTDATGLMGRVLEHLRGVEPDRKEGL